MFLQENTGYTSAKEHSHQKMLFGENVTTDALNNLAIKRKNREKMIDWYYEIAEYCNFNIGTATIATSYLDCFIEKESVSTKIIDPYYFQFAAMTAFYTTIKMSEVDVMNPTILSYISQGLYTKDEFEQMELKMLSGLKWSKNSPNCIKFVGRTVSNDPSNYTNNKTNDIEFPASVKDSIDEQSKIKPDLLRDDQHKNLRKHYICNKEFKIESSTNESKSTIDIMLRQEQIGYSCTDYLCQQRSHNNMSNDAFHSCKSISNNRQAIINWYFQIAEFCEFDNEIVAITVSYLDRFVATEIGSKALIDPARFKLAGMTAFYTAVKINEAEKLNSKLMSRLSKSLYTKDEFERMEMEILSALNWRMNPPTAMDFVRQFVEIIQSHSTTNISCSYNDLPISIKSHIYDISKLQTELSVRDNQTLTTKSSLIAFASFMNSLESISFPNREFVEYIRGYLSKITKINCFSEEFAGIQYLLCNKLKKNMNGITK